MRETEFDDEEISSKEKRDANSEKRSRGKMLGVVDGGFKSYSTVIPSNDFTKS